MAASVLSPQRPGSSAQTERVNAVINELETKIVYWAMKRAVKDEVLKPRFKVTELSSAVPKILKDLHLTPKLRNLIYDIARDKQFCEGGPPREPRSASPEPADAVIDAASWALQPVPGKSAADDVLDTIRDARKDWDNRIAERMNSASRNGVPWVRVRLVRLRPAPASSGSHSHQRWAQGRDSMPKALTPCYEDSDILDAITNLRSHNHKGEARHDDAHLFLVWGRVHVQLRRPLRREIKALRRKFAMLSPQQRCARPRRPLTRRDRCALDPARPAQAHRAGR